MVVLRKVQRLKQQPSKRFFLLTTALKVILTVVVLLTGAALNLTRQFAIKFPEDQFPLSSFRNPQIRRTNLGDARALPSMKPPPDFVIPVSSSANKSSSATDYMTSCILIMDDNHWLVEWLAYHWTTVNLRYMIIAIDERSKTSPISILDRWKGKIEFELWNDSHFFTTIPADAETLQEINLQRQKTFLAKCMQTLKQKKPKTKWVMFTDTDEFITINPRVNRPQHPLYRPYAPKLDEKGSILHFLNRERQESGTTCFSMGRLQFSPDESLHQLVSKSVPLHLNGSSFLSLRWLRPAEDLVGPKNVLDLSSVPLSQIPQDKTHQHRVISEVCGEAGFTWNRKNSLLQIYHYLGTLEQFNFRNDARLSLKDAGRNNRFTRYTNVSTETYDDLRPWLTGFVNQVGKVEAMRLLEGVGRTQGWPSAAAHQHRFAPLDISPAIKEDTENNRVVRLSTDTSIGAKNGNDRLQTDETGEEVDDEPTGSKNVNDSEDRGELEETDDEREAETDVDVDDEEHGDTVDRMDDQEQDDKERSKPEHYNKKKDTGDENLSIVSISSSSASAGERSIPGEDESREGIPLVYSEARKDRSGAVVADMMLAHAYAYTNNLRYGGACSREPLPHQERTEKLITAIGLKDLLQFACPENKSIPILTRQDYATKNTDMFTRPYLDFVRSRVHYPSQRHGGAVVHVRRGDVSPCGSYANRYLPNSHYVEILSQFVPSGVPVTIFSESETLESWDAFQNYTLQLDTDLADAWQSMMTADYVVLSKSSFSFVPAMLNQNATVIYTPFMQKNLPGWLTVPTAIQERSRQRVLELINTACSLEEKRIARTAIG